MYRSKRLILLLMLNLGTWRHEQTMKAGRRENLGKKNLTKDGHLLDNCPAYKAGVGEIGTFFIFLLSK